MNLRHSFFLLPFLLGLPLLGASFKKDAWSQPSLQELRALQLTAEYEKWERQYLPKIQPNNSVVSRASHWLPRHIPVIIIPAPVAKMLFERLSRNLQRQHSTLITATRLPQLPQRPLLITYPPPINASPKNEPDQKHQLASISPAPQEASIRRFLPAPSQRTNQHVSPHAIICNQEHYNEVKAYAQLLQQLLLFLPKDLTFLIISYSHLSTLTPLAVAEKDKDFWFKPKPLGGDFYLMSQHLPYRLPYFFVSLCLVEQIINSCTIHLPHQADNAAACVSIAPWGSTRVVLNKQQGNLYLNLAKINTTIFGPLEADIPKTLTLDQSEKELKSMPTVWSWIDLDNGQHYETSLPTYQHPNYQEIQWTYFETLNEIIRQKHCEGKTLFSMQPVIREDTLSEPFILLEPLHAILGRNIPHKNKRIYKDSRKDFPKQPDFVIFNVVNIKYFPRRLPRLDSMPTLPSTDYSPSTSNHSPNEPTK